MILSCQNISKAFVENQVLKNVSFHIEDHEKAAIVGINGAGKTTLLRIIVGEMTPDDGQVVLAKDKTLGYLAQNSTVDTSHTIYEELLSVKADLLRLEEKIRECENNMKHAEGDALEDLMKQYTSLTHAFETGGGYLYRSELVGVLKGLGFTEDEFSKPVATLSGGQKTRVALGRLLLQNPDLIILDEPTNHLDMNSIAWLETYLLNYKGAVLIVSHDRYFLDRIAGKVIEIDQSKATTFMGNYSDYAVKKEQLRVAAWNAYMNQQREIKHQEEVIEKLKSFNREKSIKRAESREKMLDKIEVIEKPSEVRTDMKLTLTPRILSGNDVLTVEHLSKSFDSHKLFTDVNFEIKRSEHVAIIGDNGSGKTTLMNMLSGIYYPDEGQIFVDGKEVEIRSPKDAFDLHIGMIHQHFKLVDVFTAAENIVLGLPGEKGKMDKAAVGKAVREIADRYGFDIDPNQKIYEMSVSQKQTVEIVKVLYRGADILILDEPTAVLTPQETEKLFTVMRNMKKDGKAIIIITHKLHEVLAVSDRVAVLRKGEYIGDTDTATASQQSLTDMMVGRAVSLNIDRPLNENQTERLKVEHLTVKNKEGVKMLDDVSFSAMGGEILGIAGIAGSGQKELLEAISGLQKLEEGSKITYIEPDGSECLLNGMDPLDIIRKGLLLSFVPEDRFGMGLVGGMNIIQNIMLRTYRRGKGPITDRKFPRDLSQKIVDDLEVVTPDIGRTPIRRLSGGNVQKVLVGREIAQQPSVLMTAYAVRGLDINTSYTIYNLLTEQKMKGVAVVYVGEDLDVLLELCDRIVVLCGGKVSGVVDGRKTNKLEVGAMMTRVEGGKADE